MAGFEWLKSDAFGECILQNPVVLTMDDQHACLYIMDCKGVKDVVCSECDSADMILLHRVGLSDSHILVQHLLLIPQLSAFPPGILPICGSYASQEKQVRSGIIKCRDDWVAKSIVAHKGIVFVLLHDRRNDITCLCYVEDQTLSLNTLPRCPVYELLRSDGDVPNPNIYRGVQLLLSTQEAAKGITVYNLSIVSRFGSKYGPSSNPFSLPERLSKLQFTSDRLQPPKEYPVLPFSSTKSKLSLYDLDETYVVADPSTDRFCAKVVDTLSLDGSGYLAFDLSEEVRTPKLLVFGSTTVTPLYLDISLRNAKLVGYRYCPVHDFHSTLLHLNQHLLLLTLDGKHNSWNKLVIAKKSDSWIKTQIIVGSDALWWIQPCSSSYVIVRLPFVWPCYSCVPLAV